MAGFKSIVVLSDIHAPYNHPDLVAFCKYLDKKYKPDKVLCLGDEVDNHSWSFHDPDPELLSPGAELETAINRLKPLMKMWPDMDIMESNHGSMVYRKQKAHGLPVGLFKSYREILGAPKGWKWHEDLTLKASDGMPIYFCHGRSKNVLKLSQSLGMSCIQGHYHEDFSVHYWGNSMGLYWAATAGCLIEKSSLAFAYGKLNLKRPIIGTICIKQGHPVFEAMLLDKTGRWIDR